MEPASRWRKAGIAIRVCLRLHRAVGATSDGVLQPADHVTINVRGDRTSEYSHPHLVKGKRHDCLRRMGGGAGIAASLTEQGIPGDVRRHKKPKARSFLAHLWDAFIADVFLPALLVCAAVSLGFGIHDHGLKDGWYDGATILFAVFLVSGVSAAASHCQAKRYARLASVAVTTVVRANRRQEVSVFDVGVGDVVELRPGDAVPADGVFLTGHGLQVVGDSSSSSMQIDAENNPFLPSGVKVVDGYGTMLVTAVGSTHAAGGEGDPPLDTEPTAFQKRLEGLATSMATISGAVGLVLFTVLAARNYTGTTGKPLYEKGIPLAVTLTLGFSVKHVAKDGALVRRLSASETMGSVTVICTDKTGTLTQDRMEVPKFWVGTDQLTDATAIDAGVLSVLRQGVGLNTTGSVYTPDNGSPPEISGSPTEKALLSWAVSFLGMVAGELTRNCKVVHMQVFNPETKYSGVTTRDDDTGAVVAHVKGAAEMVLASCSSCMGADGAARELGVEQRKKFDEAINDMAARSLRCIAFAYKQLDGTTEQPEMDDRVGLTLLALVGLKNPCRPEVKATIEACTNVGVAVKMVTGDNIQTARAIATECGIISSNDPDIDVIEGRMFRDMQPELVDKVGVMARSTPHDKLEMVKRLKEKGHVVAVITGDGTHDAEALKEADVGLSMGVRAWESRSDIIILHDKFDAVPTAIQSGRWVHRSMQKLIQYHITANMTALVVNFVCAVATENIALTTAQLLWVNLVMDTMGALALAMDKQSATMDPQPIARNAPLITKAMWRNMAAQAAFQVAVLLALQYLGADIFGTDDKANGAMIFSVFMLCQVFNVFNARETVKRNIFAGVLENWMFLVVVAAMLVLQVVTVEVLTRFAGTERLDPGQWGICVGIAAVSWPVGLAAKFIPVPACQDYAGNRASSEVELVSRS